MPGSQKENKQGRHEELWTADSFPKSASVAELGKGVVLFPKWLQVPTNILPIANPFFSEAALKEYLLGKDDLMMNGHWYDDQYPVDGTLDIQSRAQRNKVESKKHGVATEAVYAGSAKSGHFLSESDTEREGPETHNGKREEPNSNGH